MCLGAMIALSRVVCILGVNVNIANKSLITGYRCSFWFLMIHVFGLHSSLIEIERIGKCKKTQYMLEIF